MEPMTFDLQQKLKQSSTDKKIFSDSQSSNIIYTQKVPRFKLLLSKYRLDLNCQALTDVLEEKGCYSFTLQKLN